MKLLLLINKYFNYFEKLNFCEIKNIIKNVIFEKVKIILKER